MVFPSFEFAIFFPIVLAVSWALMPRPVLWKPFILLASYVFYAAARPTFCLLLAGVTVWNHYAALLIDGTERERRRKWICGVAVVGNLFRVSLMATGGSGAGYAFQGIGLPSWLTLSSDGVLSGTPTASGLPLHFSVKVVDSNSGTTTQNAYVWFARSPATTTFSHTSNGDSQNAGVVWRPIEHDGYETLLQVVMQPD